MKGAISIICFVIITIHQFCIKTCESQTPLLAQTTKLWENQNCAGHSLTLVGQNTKKLSNPAFTFDNKAKSVSGTGVWLFYEDADYEGEMEFDFQPTEQCYNFLDIGGKISSVRYAGSGVNAYADMITLYPQDWFRGDFENYFPIEVPNVAMSVGSIIISGDKTWTLYSEINFQGNSVCVGSEDYNPSFICEMQMVFSSPVKSAKIGCHATPPTVIKTNCNAGFE